MSDTPKADALQDSFATVADWFEFARNLERENAALRAELAPLRETVGVRGDATTCREDINYWSKLVARSDSAIRLERENAELRKDVYCCPPTSENSYEGFKWSDACEELENENAALRADKERLDWLEANSRESIYGPSWRIAWEFGQDVSLRAVIDAARKEAQP